jgi:hypothetical protein
MVLADPEDVQPYLIGVLDLLDEIVEMVGRGCGHVPLAMRRCEAVNADLHSESG